MRNPKFLSRIIYGQLRVLRSGLDWKNNCDHTFSCQWDCRLFTSWGPIEGSPWTTCYNRAVMYGGFQGGFQLSFMLPRDTSILAQLCIWLLLFFLSGYGLNNIVCDFLSWRVRGFWKVMQWPYCIAACPVFCEFIKHGWSYTSLLLGPCTSCGQLGTVVQQSKPYKLRDWNANLNYDRLVLQTTNFDDSDNCPQVSSVHSLWAFGVYYCPMLDSDFEVYCATVLV